MSTTHRPTSAPHTDRPTATYPTRRPVLPATSRGHLADPASPFADWRGQAPTEELPAVTAFHRRTPSRVSTSAKPTGSRSAAQRGRRPLRAALAGIALAAVLLCALQLYAAAGISSARQAALAEQDTQATEQAPAQSAPARQADAPATQWVVEGTTTAVPSPLDLPRCTTSPDTPLPCLATISPDLTRAVVLEEDASLTALTRR